MITGTTSFDDFRTYRASVMVERWFHKRVTYRHILLPTALHPREVLQVASTRFLLLGALTSFAQVRSLTQGFKKCEG